MKGIFKPIDCLLWSESVDVLVNLVSFPPGFVSVQRKKKQAKQNASLKRQKKGPE